MKKLTKLWNQAFTCHHLSHLESYRKAWVALGVFETVYFEHGFLAYKIDNQQGPAV